MQHFLRNFCSRSNRFWVSWVKWSEWLTGRSCQGIDDASSANSTAPEGEKNATKAGFDRGSWVVSEKTAEDSSSPLSASICCSTFWWNVSTTSFSPRANMQTAAFSWRLILLWFCVKTNPFALQSLLGASQAIVILNFSSFSNAMQTCKWYIGSPLLMVLVLVHSRIFFGNWVFRAFLASCATAFDHALAKLNIDLGFKMKVPSTTRADTTVEVRGHRETRLETWLDCFTCETPCDQVYIGIYFRYTLCTFHGKTLSDERVILWSTILYDCVCQKGSFCFGSSPFADFPWQLRQLCVQAVPPHLIMWGSENDNLGCTAGASDGPCVAYRIVRVNSFTLRTRTVFQTWLHHDAETISEILVQRWGFLHFGFVTDAPFCHHSNSTCTLPHRFLANTLWCCLHHGSLWSMPRTMPPGTKAPSLLYCRFTTTTTTTTNQRFS